jgi:hypothetical protein
MDRHIASIKAATSSSLAPIDKLPHFVRVCVRLKGALN